MTTFLISSQGPGDDRIDRLQLLSRKESIEDQHEILCEPIESSMLVCVADLGFLLDVRDFFDCIDDQNADFQVPWQFGFGRHGPRAWLVDASSTDGGELGQH